MVSQHSDAMKQIRKMIKPGKIYLFPCPISEGKTESLSTETISFLHQTKYFIVERAKTARHFLKVSQSSIANCRTQ
jgi:16S rRNA C1402 (ribose-2'-O) methylase RsmI